MTVLRDTTPPTLSSSLSQTVAYWGLYVTYSEVLDRGSVPSGSAFTVTVDDVEVDVTAVRFTHASQLTLQLASAVTHGQTVTVSYTVPTGAGAKPIRDLAGNNAAAFSDVEVRQRHSCQ